MKHLSAADLLALTGQLQAMERTVLDEIRNARTDTVAGEQAQAHEVGSFADAAEGRRLDDIRFAETEIDRARLHDIEQARRRIEQGLYGLCVACGREIPRARLLAQPIAVRCAACQAELEVQRQR